MYLDHFGLSRQPFQITPDADFFYPGAERQNILQGLIHSAEHNEGIVRVIGEIGSGKSLLCRMLANGLPDNFRVVFLANPNLDATAVVTAILADLGITQPADAFTHPTQLLQTYLLEQNRLGNRVLLLVEEAQAMPAATLEALRLLTNLETAETKLLRMILFGQPELDLTLSEYTLRQFRDRITQNFYLRAMRPDESAEYLHHRLCVAGYQGEPLFQGELIQQLQRITDGRLRPLNILADKTLLAAYVDDVHEVTQLHLQRAQQELESPTQNHPSPPAEITWGGIGTFVCRKTATLARKLLLSCQQGAHGITTTLKLWGKRPLAQRLRVNLQKQWAVFNNLIRQK